MANHCAGHLGPPARSSAHAADRWAGRGWPSQVHIAACALAKLLGSMSACSGLSCLVAVQATLILHPSLDSLGGPHFSCGALGRSSGSRCSRTQRTCGLSVMLLCIGLGWPPFSGKCRA